MTMDWALTVMITAPLLSALLSLLMKSRAAMERLQSTHAAVLVAMMGVVVSGAGGTAAPAIGNILRTDALSAFMDLMLAFVGATGLLYALGYMGEELTRGHLSLKRYGRFFCFLNLYLFAMLLAANLDNIALMWIAIEGSTLSAALLINFERTKTALEAGWKYIILSFVGIALALFGTVLVYYASEHVLGVRMEALQWSALYQAASELNPTALELAFIFIVIGYGTKAGIAPMHTWLPDAHAEAPAPVSAYLSALMLNLAVYAILRFKSIVDPAVGADFSGPILLSLGLVSIGTAAIFMLIQRDYKRLFAYSSIEHIGIVLVGFGVGGPAGVFGGLFHMIGHALAKSTAFCAAGAVLLGRGTKEIEHATGLVRRMPLVGGALALSALALAGMPPFGLFISEVLIATGAYSERPWAAVLFLVLLSVAFGAMVCQVFRMAFGEPKEADRPIVIPGGRFAAVSLIAGLIAMASIGIHLPGFLRDLFIPMTQIFDSAAHG
jgi:hydrogenase-4 component F